MEVGNCLLREGAHLLREGGSLFIKGEGGGLIERGDCSSREGGGHST